MDSSEYVARNPFWKPFLAAESVARRLLEDARAGVAVEGAVDQFLIHATGSPTTVAAFVASARFGQMRDMLWQSYYSNLALDRRRASDRPRLEFWIRFWHFLERLASGEPVAALAGGFALWRLAVPHELMLAEPAEPDAGAARPSLPRADLVAEATRLVRELRSARSRVKELLRAKLAASAEPVRGRAAVPGLSALSAPTPLPVTGAGPPTVIRTMKNFGSIKSGDPRIPPWRLSTDELDEATLAALGSLDVDVTRRDGPEIEALLDEAIADAVADLHGLQHVDEIAIVRGVPTRRRRRLTAAELGTEESVEA
jgi:hypothetical protein